MKTSKLGKWHPRCFQEWSGVLNGRVSSHWRWDSFHFLEERWWPSILESLRCAGEKNPSSRTPWSSLRWITTYSAFCHFRDLRTNRKPAVFCRTLDAFSDRRYLNFSCFDECLLILSKFLLRMPRTHPRFPQPSANAHLNLRRWEAHCFTKLRNPDRPIFYPRPIRYQSMFFGYLLFLPFCV